MVFVTVTCESCGEDRLGKTREDGVEPVQEACPGCGSEAFTYPTEE